MRPRLRPLTFALAASALLAAGCTPSLISGSAVPAAPTSTSSGTVQAASGTVQAASDAPAPPTQKDRLLYMLNAERGRRGLAPLALRSGVADVAREWAAELARSGSLRHRPDLPGALRARGVDGFRSTGETVGYGGSVDQVLQSFMASPAHRALLLGTSFDEVGIGVTAAGGVMWVTIDLVGY